MESMVEIPEERREQAKVRKTCPLGEYLCRTNLRARILQLSEKPHFLSQRVCEYTAQTAKSAELLQNGSELSLRPSALTSDCNAHECGVRYDSQSPDSPEALPRHLTTGYLQSDWSSNTSSHS
jgi:hypothetical protein